MRSPDFSADLIRSRHELERLGVPIHIQKHPPRSEQRRREIGELRAKCIETAEVTSDRGENLAAFGRNAQTGGGTVGGVRR